MRSALAALLIVALAGSPAWAMYLATNVQAGQTAVLTPVFSAVPQALTWFVNGVQGGNATVGKVAQVCPAGQTCPPYPVGGPAIYTAPATVPTGGVMVTARNAAGTTIGWWGVQVYASPAPPSFCTFTGTPTWGVGWNHDSGTWVWTGAVSGCAVAAGPSGAGSYSGTVTQTISYNNAVGASIDVISDTWTGGPNPPPPGPTQDDVDEACSGSWALNADGTATFTALSCQGL